MKKFFEAEIEVVNFNVTDVITVSGGNETTTPTLPSSNNSLGWG